MAQIIINEDQLINGKFTVNRTANDGKITTQGRLMTHRYFEEINALETDRYRVENINVFAESFGSDDFNIIYDFTADSIIVKFGQTPFSDDEVEKLEVKLCGVDGK